MQWTESQQKVIDTRNRNLLVSAAAGSGKTAVEVERIIQIISDENHPVDIDRLLVMTFTNAAAAEMRERIGLALEQKLREQPHNEHLQVQAALVPHAQITTIDSFCISLIRDHFNVLDIDPAFRIGDEGELRLLRADVMEQMLEDYYQREDPVFQQFVETYATGKADAGISDSIMQVYTFAQSNPFPASWIDQCRRELQTLGQGDLDDTRWASFLMEDVKRQFSELRAQMADAAAVCEEPDGPAVYLPNLLAEQDMLAGLSLCGNYGELYEALGRVSFGRLSAARGKDIDPEKKNFVTEVRNRTKKIVSGLQETYGSLDPKQAVDDILGAAPVVLKLLELAEEFARRYQEMKRDKNIVDFNDMEHYALQILVREEETDGGSPCLYFKETADELSAQYEEILVDEYQDSNQVQETLIQSLSGQRFGRPNVFMVGDVKQSIYKFRLARPEIFMEKYETYTEAESPSQKIELHQNFRSRASVLDSVNRIFYQIMTRNLGNVEYNESAALHPGAVFAEPEAGQEHLVGTSTELLMIDTGKDSLGALDDEAADFTARELEAKLIAARIRQLTDPDTGLKVWDKERKAYRTAEYGDMVILLRSISGWSESFIQVLTREGIPAFAETGTGYFDTLEVETVLAMLAVIDNPMQDIPLASVFRAPFVGLSEEELAWMMAAYKRQTGIGEDRGLYGAAMYWMAREEGMAEGAESEGVASETMEPSIRRKLWDFWSMLSRLRSQAAYLPIHELIFRVYQETGYYDYVSAMPAGETRRANLDMLLEKASAYEKTSYKGLFQFIRYINLLKKYDTDFGEASASGNYDGMVRIMSIHKSKGLEFPVVFLAGMGKKFNKQDVRGKLMIDADLGIGTDFLDLERRTKCSTLKKDVMKRKMDLDNLGEELRVLYVAMTRAREKLIMTAADRSLEKKLEKWGQSAGNFSLADGENGGCKPVPFTVLSSAGCYLDWVLMTHPQDSPLFAVSQVPVESLVGQEVARQMEKAVTKGELLALDRTKTYDAAMGEMLEHSFSYCYRYQADVNLHTKMSVSELKKQGQNTDDLQGPYYPAIPEYLSRGKNAEGSESLEDREARREAMKKAADRGTAYHRILELLDFTDAETREDVKRQIQSMAEAERITETTAGLVRAEVIWRLASSPLGQRIKKAQLAGTCHRETQFVMGLPACEMGLGESEELVLIQGIVDAWLEEEDGLVIVDYKTDRIQPGQEAELVSRYRLQLTYYQKALEQITGKAVKEGMIYSLALQKEIRVF